MEAVLAYMKLTQLFFFSASMDNKLKDKDILELIGDGTVSDIDEAEDSDEEDGDGTHDFLALRVPDVEEEVIQDEVFLNDLNNMSKVDDVIDRVVRDELGLELNEEHRPSVFDYITDSDDIT